MNILITGIEGFVGKYLVEAIKSYYNDFNTPINIYGTYLKKDDMPCFIKQNMLFNLDITDKNSVDIILNNINPDYIFHLAAQSSVSVSWNNPQITFDINVNGTLNILNSIKAINPKCKILVVGSSDEYGIVENEVVNEDHPLKPQNPYGISKVSQEMLCRLYAKAYNMNIIMTRSFNHIGPGQAPIFVISDWAKQIVDIEKGYRKPIINVGSIDVIRDFTDVRDIVKAYIELINKGINGEVYNVGSGNANKLKDILDILISYSSVNIDVNISSEKLRPVENKIIKCNNKKIFDLCGWKPNICINDTLKDVLKYWENKE